MASTADFCIPWRNPRIRGHHITTVTRVYIYGFKPINDGLKPIIDGFKPVNVAPCDRSDIVLFVIIIITATITTAVKEAAMIVFEIPSRRCTEHMPSSEG